MISIIDEILNSSAYVKILWLLVFIMLIIAIFNIFLYFKNDRLKEKIQNLYSQMSDKERERERVERSYRELHGAGRKKDLLFSIDERLSYSGLKDKFKWLTTELFIIIEILSIFAVFTIVVYKYSLLIAFASIFITLICWELLMITTIGIVSKRVEAALIQFMDIIANFSSSSDDLISILDLSSRYVDEPLASSIGTAVTEARATGDSMGALQRLQDKIKSNHFKVLLRNLEISSRYESNYTEIIAECKGMFHNYIRAEKQKTSIKLSGLASIIIMLFVGGFCINIVGGMAGKGGNIIQTLAKGGTTGYVIIAYLAVAVLASMYIAVFKVIKK